MTVQDMNKESVSTISSVWVREEYRNKYKIKQFLYIGIFRR